MLKDILRLSFLGFLLIAIAGCEVSDPGSALPNQPPNTTLVLAPMDSAQFNHFTLLKWSGTDPDGEIAGFWIVDWLFADGDTLIDTLMFTEAYEDTIPFYAPDTLLWPHRIQVTAVDNGGLQDPTPPSRFFYAVNTPPSVSFASSNIPEGETVGMGFAIELEGEDLNPSSLFYSIAIDDSVGGWSVWTPYPTFLFCDKSLDFLPCTTATWLNVPCSATLIDNDILTPGEHTIYARVKDAGEAPGLAMISVGFTIAEGLRPTMDTLVIGAYGSDEFYADGSVFYQRNRETVLTFSASAADYHGQINAYRYSLGDDPFGSWQDVSEIVILNASAGEHDFNIMARDVAGELSDTVSYRIYILEPEFTDSILIVDETADVGVSPDLEVDDFYEAMVGSRPHRQLDYASHQIGSVSYLSPLDIYRFSLIVYHGDDFGNLNLGDTQTILAEYMDLGGDVIFSGWDLLAAFDFEGDTASYSEGSFPYDYMRLFKGVRSSGTNPRECVGLKGVGGYPDVAIDPDKLPSSWNGAMFRCWAFTNRGETFTTATFAAVSDTLAINRQHAGHVYLGPTYNVAVFSIPLYFCYEDQALAFMNMLFTEMGY